MTQADEQFHNALLAWRAEPYDGEAVDDQLSRIARPDPQAAVDAYAPEHDPGVLVGIVRTLGGAQVARPYYLFGWSSS